MPSDQGFQTLMAMVAACELNGNESGTVLELLGRLVIGSGGLTITTVTLTNAQILALPTTAQAIIAAQSGKNLIPFLALLQFNRAANVTNIDAAATLKLQTATGAAAVLTGLAESASQVSGLLAGGADTLAVLAPVASSVFAVSAVSGLALNLVATNAAAGNFTGGNAANTLQVNVFSRAFTAIT